MAEPRYEVHSVTGWPINPGIVTRGGREPTTAFAVLDTAYCYREVATFVPNRKGHPSASKLREEADAECARLNALEEAER